MSICKSRIIAQYPDIIESEILIFEDEGFSGGNTNRPQFKEMMRLVKLRKIKAIYSYRLDRISRSVVDFANMYEVLNELDVAYISATECYETSTPLGRAMMSIATVFAQLERETTAERIRDNMHTLAKSGRWLGGITPTGYKSTQTVGSITVDGRERKAYKLDIISAEAETVRLIYGTFLKENSLTKTETFLLQNGVKSKNGCNYTRFSIKAILQNPVYMAADFKAEKYFKELGVEIFARPEEFNGKHGIMAYNKTLQRDGRANKTRNAEEWIVAVGKHKPIIKSDDWIKAQELILQNSSKSFRKPKSNQSLLSGLLFCGSCGSFMRPKKSMYKTDTGEDSFTYICEMKEKSRLKNCRMNNINGNLLDKAVGEIIKELKGDSNTFVKAITEVSGELCGIKDDYEKQIECLNKNYKENEKKIKGLINAAAISTPETVKYINEEIEELGSRNREITDKISKLRAFAESDMLTDSDLKAFKAVLSSFKETYESMNTQDKRAVLRALVRRIEWDGENVRIFLYGDNERDLDADGFRTLSEYRK